MACASFYNVRKILTIFPPEPTRFELALWRQTATPPVVNVSTAAPLTQAPSASDSCLVLETQFDPKAPIHRTFIGAGCLAALALIAWVDWATGPEIVILGLYLLPSIFVAWFLGSRASVLMALACSAAWCVVELNFGRAYSNSWIPYWNTLLHGGVGCFVGILTAAFRTGEEAMRQEMLVRKQAQAQLQIEREVTEAIESEHQRLGQDLHDGLGQHLVSAGFAASMLASKLADRGLPEGQDALQLNAMISDAIGESRRLARGLFPVTLEAEGLRSALEELAENINFRTKVRCTCAFAGVEHRPPLSVSARLYRIAQEATNNALRHGTPGKIELRIDGQEQELILSISNDGRSFHRDSRNRGIGLRIMEHRTHQLGGEFTISAPPAGGTLVACKIPMPRNT